MKLLSWIEDQNKILFEGRQKVYNLKVKSLLESKINNNILITERYKKRFKIKKFQLECKQKDTFIYNKLLSLFFFRKALGLIESIAETRGIIYIIGDASSHLKYKFKELDKFNLNVVFFDSPSIGLLSNRQSFLNTVNKKLRHVFEGRPDLVIVLNNNNNGCESFIKEAVLQRIPVIAFIEPNMQFDNIAYPIFLSTQAKLLDVYIGIFYLSILQGLYKEKKRLLK